MFFVYFRFENGLPGRRGRWIECSPDCEPNPPSLQTTTCNSLGLVIRVGVREGMVVDRSQEGPREWLVLDETELEERYCANGNAHDHWSRLFHL